MNSRPVFTLILAALVGNVASNRVIDRSTEIKATSKFGQRILQEARSLENNNYDEFVADYSIKFQGCHHVQQWNADADDEDDVRVKTKRLVRFRLCPTESCTNSKSAGCSSKYGDYVVDMNTFVSEYLYALEDEKDDICNDASADCEADCANKDEYNSCMYACYESYDVTFCWDYLSYNNNNNGNDNEEEEDDEAFDPVDYAECARFEFDDNDNEDRRRLDNNEVEYYIGPYCADQGGEVHLGLFTDETCTTYASNGETTFYDAVGYELPYSEHSLISNRCFACGTTENGYTELKDVCADVYTLSGKCETRMSTDYPNESSCSYIEGIKIIREDGVIRTSTVKKSKAAAVCIGLFLTMAVLLAGYVYYLRTKLTRAQINLAAASQTLG